MVNVSCPSNRMGRRSQIVWFPLTMLCDAPQWPQSTAESASMWLQCGLQGVIFFVCDTEKHCGQSLTISKAFYLNITHIKVKKANLYRKQNALFHISNVTQQIEAHTILQQRAQTEHMTGWQRNLVTNSTFEL